MAYPQSIGEGVGIYAFDGTTLRRIRTPVIFKSVPVTANGLTNIWTPAGGKTWRLLKYYLEISGNAIQAAAGVITVTFYDDAAPIDGLVHSLYVPGASANVLGGYNIGQLDLGGRGIGGAVADNILKLNLSAALTGGNIRVNVCGTEE